MRDIRDQKSLWTTLPGFLTGVAGLIAVGGLIGGIGGIAIAGLNPTLTSDFDFNERDVTSYSHGQYREALNYYQQALIVDRETGDRAGEGQTLYNIGKAHAALGHFGQALESYRQALAVYREVGDRAEEGKTLYNIWRVQDALGQYGQPWRATSTARP